MLFLKGLPIYYISEEVGVLVPGSDELQLLCGAVHQHASESFVLGLSSELHG
jgi:hypothetical protein